MISCIYYTSVAVVLLDAGNYIQGPEESLIRIKDLFSRMVLLYSTTAFGAPLTDGHSTSPANQTVRSIHIELGEDWFKESSEANSVLVKHPSASKRCEDSLSNLKRKAT